MLFEYLHTVAQVLPGSGQIYGGAIPINTTVSVVLFSERDDNTPIKSYEKAGLATRATYRIKIVFYKIDS